MSLKRVSLQKVLVSKWRYDCTTVDQEPILCSPSGIRSIPWKVKGLHILYILPSGKYCIYRKGGSCPISLTSGYIKWDDEDSNNKNNKTGTLPDGVYDHNTKIYFCCRTDGDKNTPISLPTRKPFFLLGFDSAECQQVKWAVVSAEWIRFDNEDDKNKDGQGGSHPHGAGIDDHKIHYCYYQGKKIEVLNRLCHHLSYSVIGLFLV